MSSEITPSSELQKLLDKVNVRSKKQQRRARIFTVVWVVLLAVTVGTLPYVAHQMKATEDTFDSVVLRIEQQEDKFDSVVLTIEQQKELNKVASDKLKRLEQEATESEEIIGILRYELANQDTALRDLLVDVRQRLACLEERGEAAKITLVDTQSKLDLAWDRVARLEKESTMLTATLTTERKLHTDLVSKELSEAGFPKQRAREITRGVLQRALLNEHVSPAEFAYVGARAEDAGTTVVFWSHWRRGARSLLTGEYAKAEEQFTLAIEQPQARVRERAEAYAYRGCARAKRGSYEKALEDLELGLRSGQSARLDAISSFFRGFVLLKLEKHGGAVTALRRAIELAPSSPAPHAYLGLTELARRNMEVASDELREAARLDPYFVETYDYQAMLFDAIGETEKAMDARARAQHLRAAAREIGRGTDPGGG